MLSRGIEGRCVTKGIKRRVIIYCCCFCMREGKLHGVKRWCPNEVKKREEHGYFLQVM
jgi:hypothetical protein